jgi:hypothetical protein
MKSHQASNVIPVQQARTAADLSKFVLWLENSRPHVVEVLKRGPGSPCHSTVVSEMHCLLHELAQWSLHLKK